MMFREVWRRCLVAVVAGSLLSGCVTSSDAAFWEAFQLPNMGLEVDPPRSLADLASGADVVVLGTVEAVSPGKTYRRELFDDHTVNVAIRATQLQGDTKGRPLVVEWDAPRTGTEAAPGLPRETYIFFLDHHPDFDTFICSVAALCVLAVAPDGTVVSPLSQGRIGELPEQPAKYRGVEDLYEKIT